MLRKDIIKMFEEIGCKKCKMFKDDDDYLEGLLDATDVVIDIKINLRGGITIASFCQGTIDLTSDNLAGFKDTIIYEYDDIESIEFGQLGSLANRG